MNRRSITIAGAYALAAMATGPAALADGDAELKALMDSGQLKVEYKLEGQLGDLGTRNIAVVRVELAPGVSEPRHTHPGPEVLYGLEGSGWVELDGRERVPIGPGVVVRVAAGQTKSMINESATAPLAVAAVLLLEPGTPVVTTVD